jgi:hypothetical protein
MNEMSHSYFSYRGVVLRLRDREYELAAFFVLQALREMATAGAEESGLERAVETLESELAALGSGAVFLVVEKHFDERSVGVLRAVMNARAEVEGLGGIILQQTLKRGGAQFDGYQADVDSAPVLAVLREMEEVMGGTQGSRL